MFGIGLAATPRPKSVDSFVPTDDACQRGVRGVEAKYGTDSGGEPAIWLIVDVDDDAAPSEDKLDRLNRFALSMKSKLLAAGVEAWPYVQFRSS
jgi:hypothetical protein